MQSDNEPYLLKQNTSYLFENIKKSKILQNYYVQSKRN
jgi:hypothetical protein